MPRRMAYRGERRVGAGGALWRYTGALGKAWRVYVQERGAQVPGQVRDLHARLLLALRDVLLPHLGHGDEVCCLRSLLASLAGAARDKPVRHVVLLPPAGRVDARTPVVVEEEFLPGQLETLLEDLDDAPPATDAARPRRASSSVGCEVFSFSGEGLPLVGCEVIPSFWLCSSSPLPSVGADVIPPVGFEIIPPIAVLDGNWQSAQQMAWQQPPLHPSDEPVIADIGFAPSLWSPRVVRTDARTKVGLHGAWNSPVPTATGLRLAAPSPSLVALSVPSVSSPHSCCASCLPSPALSCAAPSLAVGGLDAAAAAGVGGSIDLCGSTAMQSASMKDEVGAHFCDPGKQSPGHQLRASADMFVPAPPAQPFRPGPWSSGFDQGPRRPFFVSGGSASTHAPLAVASTAVAAASALGAPPVAQLRAAAAVFPPVSLLSTVSSSLRHSGTQRLPAPIGAQAGFEDERQQAQTLPSLAQVLGPFYDMAPNLDFVTPAALSFQAGAWSAQLEGFVASGFQARPAAAHPIFQDGEVVVTQALAGHRRNGRRGTVLGWLPDQQRYQVRVSAVKVLLLEHNQLAIAPLATASATMAPFRSSRRVVAS